MHSFAHPLVQSKPPSCRPNEMEKGDGLNLWTLTLSTTHRLQARVPRQAAWPCAPLLPFPRLSTCPRSRPRRNAPPLMLCSTPASSQPRTHQPAPGGGRIRAWRQPPARFSTCHLCRPGLLELLPPLAPHAQRGVVIRQSVPMYAKYVVSHSASVPIGRK